MDSWRFFGILDGFPIDFRVSLGFDDILWDFWDSFGILDRFDGIFDSIKFEVIS